MKKYINDKAIVRVVCGDQIGTAFFVTDNQLLTARHNVINSITDDDPIRVTIDGKYYDATLVHENRRDSGELCIIQINGYTHSDILECLSMPMRPQERYCFMGFPQTILGQLVGSVVGIDIHTSRDTFHHSEGFDCTATICGQFTPTQFNGFSGSPIYNQASLVVGIVTHKLDGCIGFVSISIITEILQDKGISCELDHSKFDQSPYSRLSNRKVIDKALNSAGPRYMRKIHVPTNQFDKYFEYAIKTSVVNNRLKEYEKSVLDIKDVLQKTSLLIFESDGYNFRDDLMSLADNFSTTNNNRDLNYWLDVLNENVVTLKEEKGRSDDKKSERYDLIEQWESFYATHCETKKDIDGYYSLIENPYICITGSAGSGKTHLLCHLAEEYVDTTNVYLCFGNQFDVQREIEVQLQQIFEFGSRSYLQELNEISHNNRAVIIIDAINEGVGYHLWQSKLNTFIGVISAYPNICLILSVRDPFFKSLKLSNKFTKVKHNGHSDIDKARKVYFDEYKINKEDIPFETPEFRNSLFLKIFCETFSQLNLYQRKDANKLWSLFGAYVKNKEVLISDKIDFDHHLLPVRKVIDGIASVSLKSSREEFRLKDISRIDAHSVSNKIMPNRPWSKSLLYWMLQEDLLISSIRYHQPYEETDRIDFAYERMGDIFKVIAFIKLQLKEQIKLFNKIIESNSTQAYNFLVALSSILPDINDNNKEIFDIYPLQFDKSDRMRLAYMESLNYRSIESGKAVSVLKDKIFRRIEDKKFFSSFLDNI